MKAGDGFGLFSDGQSDVLLFWVQKFISKKSSVIRMKEDCESLLNMLNIQA